MDEIVKMMFLFLVIICAPFIACVLVVVTLYKSCKSKIEVKKILNSEILSRNVIEISDFRGKRNEFKRGNWRITKTK